VAAARLALLDGGRCGASGGRGVFDFLVGGSLEDEFWERRLAPLVVVEAVVLLPSLLQDLEHGRLRLLLGHGLLPETDAVFSDVELLLLVRPHIHAVLAREAEAEVETKAIEESNARAIDGIDVDVVAEEGLSQGLEVVLPPFVPFCEQLLREGSERVRLRFGKLVRRDPAGGDTEARHVIDVLEHDLVHGEEALEPFILQGLRLVGKTVGIELFAVAELEGRGDLVDLSHEGDPGALLAWTLGVLDVEGDLGIVEEVPRVCSIVG
jgi:hypothetical protein